MQSTGLKLQSFAINGKISAFTFQQLDVLAVIQDLKFTIRFLYNNIIL